MLLFFVVVGAGGSAPIPTSSSDAYSSPFAVDNDLSTLFRKIDELHRDNSQVIYERNAIIEAMAMDGNSTDDIGNHKFDAMMHDETGHRKRGIDEVIIDPDL